jgi:hypothetical protein
LIAEKVSGMVGILVGQKGGRDVVVPGMAIASFKIELAVTHPSREI